MQEENTLSFFYQNRKEQLYLYLSKNNSYAVHLHRQLELIYVLSGSTTVTVEQQDFPLKPGQGVLVFPNQMHGLKHVESGQNLLCIFEPDFCHSFRHFFQNKKPSRNDFAVSPLSEHSHIALQGLEALAATMEKDRPTPSDVQIYAEGYLTLLLADLLPSLPLQPRKSTEDLELEQRLLLYLDANYTKELSLDSLSKEFGVSRFVLSRIFTEKFHTTFPDYMNSRRLDYARDLLLSTQLSVTQIALDAGFGSSRTFFRAFQDTFHTTPGVYRRQTGSTHNNSSPARI